VRIHDAVVFGALEEALQVMLFEDGAYLVLLLWSGYSRPRATALEPFDPAAVSDLALDSRVRGMAGRAHVEHELGVGRTGRELVSTARAADARHDQLWMLVLHRFSFHKGFRRTMSALWARTPERF
jgi:hypothetical protein